MLLNCRRSAFAWFSKECNGWSDCNGIRFFACSSMSLGQYKNYNRKRKSEGSYQILYLKLPVARLCMVFYDVISLLSGLDMFSIFAQQYILINTMCIHKNNLSFGNTTSYLYSLSLQSSLKQSNQIASPAALLYSFLCWTWKKMGTCQDVN